MVSFKSSKVADLLLEKKKKIKKFLLILKNLLRFLFTDLANFFFFADINNVIYADIQSDTISFFFRDERNF